MRDCGKCCEHKYLPIVSVLWYFDVKIILLPRHIIQANILLVLWSNNLEINDFTDGYLNKTTVEARPFY